MARTSDLPDRDKWDGTTASPELIRPFSFHFERQQVGKFAQRKLRLITCASVRSLWSQLPDDVCRVAVQTGELFADALTAESELNSVGQHLARTRIQLDDRYSETSGVALAQAPPKVRAEFVRAVDGISISAVCVTGLLTFSQLSGVCREVPPLSLPLDDYMNGYSVVLGEYRFESDEVSDFLPPLIRDILGYPFAPVKLEKKWRTDTAKALADAMTAEGKFDRLPVLADALEEAGCDDADILSHCRGSGPHVRGCWVVDLIRGVHWLPKM